MADPNSALLEAIFAGRHKPLRQIGHGPGHAISFPTNKVPSGVIRAHSTLMADGMQHLDTDPNVVQLSAYPLEVAYWSTKDGTTPDKRDHIPDIAAKLRDDSVVFIDYVPWNEQLDTRFFLMWTHRPRRTEPASLTHARQIIREAKLPVTIRTISDKADFARQAILWEGDDAAARRPEQTSEDRWRSADKVSASSNLIEHAVLLA
ncbi:hypothetical protein ELI25_29515 (plasmid) [Rhizobium ruizarguesonis]|uniref:hypothetical protein n=1 Tax=Rhizobium ruizarguesonis TaxID=2081791 RepID=UPI001031B21A|nr:hypothetical protein [Rhizobium ruizarguesonis]TAW06610.1 hypothetical protein ELI25_29515 [Rhizobium ruizarguesonis]